MSRESFHGTLFFDYVTNYVTPNDACILDVAKLFVNNLLFTKKQSASLDDMYPQYWTPSIGGTYQNGSFAYFYGYENLMLWNAVHEGTSSVSSQACQYAETIMTFSSRQSNG